LNNIIKTYSKNHTQYYISIFIKNNNKELRFIFPALPLLTMAGGVGIDKFLSLKKKENLYPLNFLCFINNKKNENEENNDSKIIKNKENKKFKNNYFFNVLKRFR
jgi:hypothetical protein